MALSLWMSCADAAGRMDMRSSAAEIKEWRPREHRKVAN
jgi:hypothetical protein